MIEELWSFVEGLPARFRYRDRDILRVVLWATLKDRPMVWACQPQNWPEDLRPACLPDPSTVSRRRHGPELQKTAYALHERSVDHLGAVSRYAGLGAPEARCFPMDKGKKPAPSCVAPHETQSRLMQFVVQAADRGLGDLRMVRTLKGPAQGRARPVLTPR